MHSSSLLLTILAGMNRIERSFEVYTLNRVLLWLRVFSTELFPLGVILLFFQLLKQNFLFFFKEFIVLEQRRI